MKSTQRLIVILFASLIFILLIFGFIFISEFFKYEEKEQIEDESIIFETDEISPLENQGIIVEMNRIRHRGLLERMMDFGTSWKNKPKFYYIVTIDGLEVKSNELDAPGGSSETLFKDWDTMFQESRVTKDVDEEQETSKIKIVIVERLKRGILGLRSTDIERDSFELVYDYRTGRWKGDDYFKDKDGYGHYLGETFEIWFNIYQTDYDHDYIPYWTELNILHTDPMIDDSKRDPDRDGIPTSWEWRWGYDPFAWDDHCNLDPDLDGIQNIEEFQMEKYFADPYHQDIYIEVDGMQKGGLFDPAHVCWEESQQIMIERFAEHNINVYIDYGWPTGSTIGGGELLPHYEVISYSPALMLQFYNNHFADERKGIFRYIVICHSAGFCYPSEFMKCDTIAIGTNLKNMLNPFGAKHAYTERTQRASLGGLMMHEMGHSLGMFSHNFEGIDNLTYADSLRSWINYKDTWGKYESIMNYFNLYKYNKIMDYSDGSNGAPYDRNDWIHINVAFFELENREIADSTYKSPGKNMIINETIDFEYISWRYDENLTVKYRKQILDWSPIDPIPVDWRVYQKIKYKENDQFNEIRIYARALVEPTYSEWILFSEGFIDSNNNFYFYDELK